MIRPEDVLLLGVVLLAVLFFIGGAIDVFRVPVNPRRRRSRKPARRWRMRDRPGLTELLEEWLEAESLLDTPAPRVVEKPKRVVAPTVPVARGAPVIPMTPTFSWSPAPSRESLEHAGSESGPEGTPAVSLHNRPRALGALSFPFLMFPASAVCLALILGIFLSRGGGALPVQPPLVPADSSLVLQANQLAARGEYEAAAQKYRAAVERDPDDISLRFALGTALSHAGRQEETMEQFRWVVTRGNPSSSAVQVARRWLVSAGVLAEPGTFASSERREQKTETTGKIKGMTEANESDVKGRPRGVRIVLRGDDESNKNVVLETRVTLGEPYEFDKVPPGNYLMTAWVSETQRIWERKVAVEPGEETVHNLTEAHRPGPPNGLPDLAREQGLSARQGKILPLSSRSGMNKPAMEW